MKHKYKYKYLIVGKSGVGKSTIIDKYCKKYDTTQVLSYTTRPIRACEQAEPTHVHINTSEFEQLTEVIASTNYNGHGYATTKQQILDSEFFVVDLNGVKLFEEITHGEIPYKVIEVKASLKNKISRMRDRGDTVHSVLRRVLLDTRHFKDIRKYRNYIIKNNSTLDYANEQLCDIIIKSECEGKTK